MIRPRYTRASSAGAERLPETTHNMHFQPRRLGWRRRWQRFKSTYPSFGQRRPFGGWSSAPSGPASPGQAGRLRPGRWGSRRKAPMQERPFFAFCCFCSWVREPRRGGYLFALTPNVAWVSSERGGVVCGLHLRRAWAEPGDGGGASSSLPRLPSATLDRLLPWRRKQGGRVAVHSSSAWPDYGLLRTEQAASSTHLWLSLAGPARPGPSAAFSPPWASGGLSGN